MSDIVETLRALPASRAVISLYTGISRTGDILVTKFALSNDRRETVMWPSSLVHWMLPRLDESLAKGLISDPMKEVPERPESARRHIAEFLKKQPAFTADDWDGRRVTGVAVGAQVHVFTNGFTMAVDLQSKGQLHYRMSPSVAGYLRHYLADAAPHLIDLSAAQGPKN